MYTFLRACEWSPQQMISKLRVEKRAGKTYLLAGRKVQSGKSLLLHIPAYGAPHLLHRILLKAIRTAWMIRSKYTW